MTSLYRLSITLFLVLHLLIIPLTSISKHPQLDSLQNELKHHPTHDSIKVKLLNAIAFRLYTSDTDKSIEYITEAKNIAINIGYTKGEAKAYYNHGIVESIKSNFTKAMKHYQHALNIYKTIDSKRGISTCCTGIGSLYYYQGDYEKALKYYNITLEIQTELKIDIGASLNNIAIVYSHQGKYDMAITYFKEALKLEQKHKNTKGIAISFTNLGATYINFERYHIALEYFNKALEIYHQLDNKNGEATTLINMGNIYFSQQNFEEALKYYEKTLKINKALGNKMNIAMVLKNIGKIHIEINNNEIAKKCFYEALEISETINAKQQIMGSFISLGDIELKMHNNLTAISHYKKGLKISSQIGYKEGISESHLRIAESYYALQKYSKALKNALNGQKMAYETGTLNLQRDSYKILSDIYHKTNKHEKAYDNHLKYKSLSDSLFNKENIKKLAQIEYEYEYKNRLKLAETREQKLTKKVEIADQFIVESEKKRLLTTIVFLLITILLGIVIFFLRLKNISSIKQNILIEQRLLRSQMTPHFIFNSLTVLQGIILNKEYKKSIRYLSRFSKLLRITLENSRNKMVLLDKELEALENYLILQNLQADNPYNYSIITDNTINKEALLIPPMMIQPFVENAIEHAFQQIKSDCSIDITLSFENKKLICKIIDNGIGIYSYKKDKLDIKESLSTTITHERLKIFAKEFNVKTDLEIIDRKELNERGTIIVITLPYEVVSS